jgi:hypothetical protein
VTNLVVQLDVSNLKMNPESIVSSFRIGIHVEEVRRKQPGVNEKGVAAEIADIYAAGPNSVYCPLVTHEARRKRFGRFFYYFFLKIWVLCRSSNEIKSIFTTRCMLFVLVLTI